MKEIKFRAWYKEEKKYYEVDGIDFKGSHIWASFQDDEGFYYDVRLGFDEIILEQYTGLKDKNGVEIYEGDLIIRYYGDDSYKDNRRYTVKFDKDRGGYYPLAKGDGCGCCEDETLSQEYSLVVGNIHESIIKED